MQNYSELIEGQRRFFEGGRTKDVEFRLEQLVKLETWIRANDERLMRALNDDLGKAPFEAYGTEIGIVLDEIKHIRRHLKRWAKERFALPPLKQFPCRCFVKPEPYGVVLIMSPWNYPFQLTVAPLVAALAAGNCALIKPSAYSPNTSSEILRMVREVFDPSYVAVVEGGRAENQALLDQRFDYICFTGSVEVGKSVMAAASKYLTPVTLELGGKSPCIVDETADIRLAAKRIAWGKFLNAGQTCVAPDYLLVHERIKEQLIDGLRQAVRAFYGEKPLASNEYPRIINEKHFSRLCGLMADEKIVFGGDRDARALKIAPTVLEADWQSAAMQEEIFGPILPVLGFSSLDEVVRLVNERPKPLALYFFSRGRARQRRMLRDISFGGGCINDTVVHLATSHMPFGGVGESGMGGYHGKAGFETFTHRKSILSKSLRLDVPLRYPPYKNHLKLLKRL